MTQQQTELWAKLLNSTAPNGLLCLAMRHAVQNLSEMVGQSLRVKNLKITTVPIASIYNDEAWGLPNSYNLEMETVGIYLLIGDDLPGQTILTISLADALSMVDWLLEEPPGTTTQLDDLGRSALAEMGNLMLSCFLNTVAEFTDNPLRPSPPYVLVDMLATVLQTAVTLVNVVTDELIIIKADIASSQNVSFMHFWLWPDPSVVSSKE